MPFSNPSRLFAQTTRWFERARASLLDELPCRPGCHRCCIGLFPVTLLDQQAIQDGLPSLPEDRRCAIAQRAADQIATVTASAAQLRDNPFIDRWSDEDIDAQAERHQSMPCPALQEDGSCGIYPFRPLTCRSMGIPTEEDLLAKEEADALSAARRETQAAGEELFLPFAFLPLPHTGMAA